MPLESAYGFDVKSLVSNYHAKKIDSRLFLLLYLISVSPDFIRTEVVWFVIIG